VGTLSRQRTSALFIKCHGSVELTEESCIGIARQLNTTRDQPDLGGKYQQYAVFLVLILPLLMFSGCGRANADAAEAPPLATVVPGVDPALFTVAFPEQFPLIAAVARPSTSEMAVTGTVMPDVSRNVPVVSLASGRVVEIHVRLGDVVKKGQPLLTIRSDDVASGFSDYRKAVADEVLARTQLERAKDLYMHGAIAMNDLEVAQDTEDKAKVDLETTEEHLRLLGNDPTKPRGMVDIYAPVSGVVTDQEVTNASAIQAFGTPSPFTISDLSSVWVVCDVYENDLAGVRVGDSADIVLNAYPDHPFKGRVSNIGSILDPNIRTAKVRIEVENPGMLRVGMFAKATFHGRSVEMHTIVPASAVLHMHDRDFVFVPAPDKRFRRVEVVGGDLLPDNVSMQEVKSGLKPGEQVVSNALVLDHVLAQ
jgi:membrane fusion protein, heavy metal efflux system